MTTRIYFACDIHGSESCFLKFVNIGKYRTYKAHVMILSGDLTGKAVVPIIQEKNPVYKTNFLGTDEVIDSQEDLDILKKRIRNVGYYYDIVSPGEYEELTTDHGKYEAMFNRLMTESLGRWISIAEERLANANVKCFMMPGNDDLPAIGGMLSKSRLIINPEDRTVDVDQHHEMISTGYSNPTPWKTPRELTEDQLTAKIEEMVSTVKDVSNSLFNFHVPPYASGLDLAPKLDEQLRPAVSMGELLKVPVGSTAVLKAIEKHQPLAGLHGHIHESALEAKIGRTMCFNAGSEYQSGILRGYIIDMEKDRLKQWLRVEA